MDEKKKRLSPLLASVIAAGFASGSATASNVPRGMDVDPLAGNCRIGSFPQTMKAGAYNALCEIMQDSEKCLAFIKDHFSVVGDSVTVDKVSEYNEKKAKYCLETLHRDLGLKR